MKNIKKKLLITLAAIVAVSSVVFAGISLNKAVAEDNTAVSLVELKTTYMLGDTLNIPSDASVKYNGTSYAVEKCYLIQPNGNAVVGKSFSLDVVGEYELVTEATAQGKKISASDNFTVCKEYYSVSKEDSKVYYGELNNTYKRKGMNNGVVAELTEGATLTIAEPLNVYAAEKVELFTFNLVRMDCDVNYLSIRLTDCYDPNIEIDIQYWKRINMETYMKAGPKGSGLVGLSSDDNGMYSIAGNTYSRGIFGTGTRGNRPMNGNYNNITLSFENTEDGKIRIWSNTPEHESNPNGDDRLITEINNERLYSQKFPGFTTGEVILSITATGFNNVKTARVEIGNIQGRKNEQLDKFGAYRDATAPDIKISADETDKKIFAGVETKIPEAVAYDASGIKSDVDYTVWYNYSDANSRRAIAVKDGRFLAKEMGTYTVEYSAEDVYGNKTKKLLELVAFKKSDSGISLNLDGKLTEAEVGSSVNLANYVVNSVCNNYSVKIFITSPSGQIMDITASAQAYNLEEVGNYTVRYECSDAYYDGEYSYSFASVESDKAVFEKRSIPAPEYYIEGATYSVENVGAYRYKVGGKELVSVKAYASYDGGEYKEISADGFRVGKAASVKLRLAEIGNESNYIESEEIKIVDVGYNGDLDVSKYFTGDFNGVAKNDYTVFTATKNGTAAMKFINPLLVSNFSFTFSVDKDAAVGGVDLILRDYYDRTKSAVISLNDGDGEAKNVSINGISYAMSESWKGNVYEITCDGTEVRFNGAAAKVDLGLSTDLCLFDVSFRSVRKGFSFNLSALCNQPFGSQTYDDVKPMVSAILPPMVVSVNDEYVTDIPLVADVLSPSANKCLLTVYYIASDDSDVEVFTDVDGKPMRELSADTNYVVRFTKYGTYTFTYSYTDGSGKRGELQQLVYVYDLIAPTIRFKNEPTSVIGVSIGKEISALEVVAEDNLTKTEDLVFWTIIYDERGRFISATQGAYVLKEKGRYTVYIHCKDEGGNASSVKYEVYAG